MGSRRTAPDPHRERARLRAALHEWATTIDPDDSEVDLRRDGTWAIREMVNERRSWDKTAPLSRWALARTQRDPQRRDASVPDQVKVFRRAFPDNLIGRHALSHVELALEWAGFARQRTDSVQSRSLRSEAEHASCRADLETLLELGWHRQLNIEIRSLCERETGQHELAGPDESAASTPTGVRALGRLLLGSHDLEAFAQHVGQIQAVRRLVTDLAGQARGVGTVISSRSPALPPLPFGLLRSRRRAVSSPGWSTPPPRSSADHGHRWGGGSSGRLVGRRVCSRRASGA